MKAIMSLMMCIEPQNPEEKLCLIELLDNYYIIISFVLQDLLKWVEVQSIKKCTEISWKKKLMIYCKRETALICSAEKQEICVFIEEKFKKEWLFLTY